MTITVSIHTRVKRVTAIAFGVACWAEVSIRTRVKRVTHCNSPHFKHGTLFQSTPA